MAGQEETGGGVKCPLLPSPVDAHAFVYVKEILEQFSLWDQFICTIVISLFYNFQDDSLHFYRTIKKTLMFNSILKRNRLLNDAEIAKSKRDFELKKAAYDVEVQTKVP